MLSMLKSALNKMILAGILSVCVLSPATTALAQSPQSSVQSSFFPQVVGQPCLTRPTLYFCCSITRRAYSKPSRTSLWPNFGPTP